MNRIKKSLIFTLVITMVLSTLTVPSSAMLLVDSETITETPTDFPSSGYNSGPSMGNTAPPSDGDGSNPVVPPDIIGNTPGDRRTTTDFLLNKSTDFESEAEAEAFLRENYGDILEPYDKINGYPLNYGAFYLYGFTYYGWADLIPEEDRLGPSGDLLALGYTQEGYLYSNLDHPEDPMRNPKPIPNADTNPYALQQAWFEPYESQWNRPAYVGEKYFPELTHDEQEALGEEIIKSWMKNVINRIPQLYPNGSSGTDADTNNGTPFNEVSELNPEKMMTMFQVVTPPTSRSYGMATAWFEIDNKPYVTHRSFLIEPTSEVDIIAEKITYYEKGNGLVIDYKIEGHEPFHSPVISELYLDRVHEDFNESGELTRLDGNDVMTQTNIYNDSDFKEAIMFTGELIEYTNFGDSGQIIVDTSEIVEEFRSEDINVLFAINTSYDPDVLESDWNNNFVKGIIPKSLADLIMKDIKTDIVSEDEIDVTAIFEMEKGPEVIPQTEVEFIYTFTDGTTGSDVVTVNDIELQKDTEAEYTINVPSGKTIQSVSAEVNFDKNLYSEDSIYIDESDYDNNMLDTSVGKAFDFSIDAVNNSKVFESDEDINIGLNATLANSTNPLDTESYAFKLS